MSEPDFTEQIKAGEWILVDPDVDLADPTLVKPCHPVLCSPWTEDSEAEWDQYIEKLHEIIAVSGHHVRHGHETDA